MTLHPVYKRHTTAKPGNVVNDLFAQFERRLREEKEEQQFN